MTVSELIEALRKMPPSADVAYIWDGAPRSCVEQVWLARGIDPYGDSESPMVMLYDCGPVYSGWARPEGAPSEKLDPYWRIPDVNLMG